MTRPHFGTLESRFYLIFTLVFFTTILTMQIISTRFTLTTVRNASLESNRLLLGELSIQVDNYISGMERISRMIIDDEDARLFLKNYEPELKSRLTERLASYARSRDDISSIVLFGRNGESISDRAWDSGDFADYRESDWYREAFLAAGETVVSTAHVQNLIPGRYSWVVSLSTVVVSPEERENIGILLVDLKFNRIKELCDSLVVGRKGYNFIVDKSGNYIYHPSLQLVYSGIKSEPIDELMPLVSQNQTVMKIDGKNYISSELNSTGWQLVSVSFDSDMVTGWPYVQLMNALIGLVLFLVVGLVTNFISKGITRPLRQLQAVMKSVETGEFRKAGRLNATDEIVELAREYDIMVGRIGELMEANAHEQELKRKSDLKALQAQVNPHFLYNTLDSIIWMGEMEKSAEVVKMTSALSRLFRISISKGRELIPLRDELEHVRSYLTIQEMRYKNKFRYLIDIPEDLLEIRVLKITLQPLVENALYHGIRSVNYTGLIEISGYRDNSTVILKVKDNGEGMDVEQLSALIAGIEPSTEPPENRTLPGTGVRNVHERIRLYFGSEFGISFDSSQDKGTEITIRIPADTRERA